MLTLRVLPPRDDNDLVALYHDGLRRHWSAAAQRVSRLLAEAGQGGWTRSERRLLPCHVRRAGLSMRDRKGLHRLLNPAACPFVANPLKNKQLFARRARAAGLRIAEHCDLDRDNLGDWLATQSDIIAKPSFQSKGQGVERFQRIAFGWRGTGGDFSESAMIAHLNSLWRAGGVIQRRLPTHEALAGLSPGALPTLRVVTCLDEQRVPEACGLALRLSAGGSRPVDNFNAGNLVLAVTDDGCCSSAWTGGGEADLARHDRHPKTDAPIAGEVIPDLDAAVAMARSAHLPFAGNFNVIGWDIGLTAEVPVLIEGNWNPGTDILQLVMGQGLSDMRIGDLYRHHLSSLPADRWHGAHVVEWERRRA